MMDENDALEEQCEDAVFQICCTRERYSTRCANQLEKYLTLNTKRQTAKVQKTHSPNFNKPIITEEQEKLFQSLDIPSEKKNEQSSSKIDVRNLLDRIKELQSIVNQIDRSKNSEINQLLQ